MTKFVNYLRAHLFAVLVFLLLLVFIPVVIYLQFGGKTPAPQSQTPVINSHPIPVPSDFNQSYDNFSQLSPGKSDLNAVEKINGPAVSTTKKGAETYLYYQTPSSDYQNTVVLKNGLLYYSLENVFGGYRGNYSDYTAAYGQPNLHLYNKDSSLSEWYIFLTQGLGTEVSGNDILQVLYFVPQAKNVFIQGIAAELGLTTASPENEGPNEPLGD